VNRGMLFGLVAYGVWGVFPLFWPLLEPAGAVEILAHRMVWSLLVVAIVMTVRRGWSELRRAPLRTWLLVLGAAVLISVNWGVYIYAVNNGAVVEAALGYFINPLLSVLLGVMIFRERLRRLQWASVALGAVAVLVIGIGGGRVPWLALALAVSFGFYGLVKKTVRLTPQASLTAEGLVVLLPALAFLTVIQVNGTSTLTTHGGGHVVLLAASGLLTVVPLIAFARASQLLPLSVMGLLQYLTPVLQFLIGVLVEHEQMQPTRWVGFVLIWVALMIFAVDAVRRARTARSEAAAVAPAV
jgi:chloramphenicol-sensitive protein RarD